MPSIHGTEADHQKALASWRNLMTHQHPDFRWLVHVPNGGKRDRRTAQYMKAEGQRAGWPDMQWPMRRTHYTGIAIELKKPDGGAGMSDEQLDALQWAHQQGWAAFCCHGWMAARYVLTLYFKDLIQPIDTPLIVFGSMQTMTAKAGGVKRDYKKIESEIDRHVDYVLVDRANRHLLSTDRDFAVCRGA